MDMLLGDFTIGAFRSNDKGLSLEKSGMFAVFDSTKAPSFADPIWGEPGQCYLLAAMNAVSRHSASASGTFLTKEKNEAGIVGFRFYIRGKPWTISIDDYLMFQDYNTEQRKLFFGKPLKNGFMWAPLLEKAFAKLKGSYMNIDDAGDGPSNLQINKLRYFTNAPIFNYEMKFLKTAQSLEETYRVLLDAYVKGYMINFGTDGADDQVNNQCGIPKGHLYSVLSVFRLYDRAGVPNELLLVKNMWGLTTYDKEWHAGDPRWTDELAAQVPLGVDPRQSAKADGVFVVPKSRMASCFDEMSVGHILDNQGYSDNWYDALDMDENFHTYYFTIPSSFDGNLYITTQTYDQYIIPAECHTQAQTTAMAHLTVYKEKSTGK